VLASVVAGGRIRRGYKARAVSHVAIRLEECYRCEEASLLVTCILKQPDDTGDPFPVS